MSIIAATWYGLCNEEALTRLMTDAIRPRCPCRNCVLFVTSLRRPPSFSFGVYWLKKNRVK